MGLMDNFCGLSKSPSGFGVRNLTYVVNKPDAFIKTLKQSKAKQLGRQWPEPFIELEKEQKAVAFSLSKILRMCL